MEAPKFSFAPEAEIFPLMSADELKELAKDIDKYGQRETVKVCGAEILDGRNRFLAVTKYCAAGAELAVEQIAPESRIAYVLSLNSVRRHLTTSQKAMAAAKSLPFFKAKGKEREKLSKGRGKKGTQKTGDLFIGESVDEAGRTVGISGETVRQAEAVIKHGSAKLADAVTAGKVSVSKAARIAKDHKDDKTEQNRILEGLSTSNHVNRMKGLTGEVEWYTPPEYIELSRKVMGDIDLDPASSAYANQHVKAAEYYDVSSNGLDQSWEGRVFLNPPYKMPLIAEFASRMCEAARAGDIEQGIMLTNNATDTEWFHLCLENCTAACLTRGRISFLQFRDGEMIEKTQPTHGQVFFYFGKKKASFAKVFGKVGAIIERIEK